MVHRHLQAFSAVSSSGAWLSSAGRWRSRLRIVLCCVHALLEHVHEHGHDLHPLPSTCQRMVSGLLQAQLPGKNLELSAFSTVKSVLLCSSPMPYCTSNLRLPAARQSHQYTTVERGKILTHRPNKVQTHPAETPRRSSLLHRTHRRRSHHGQQIHLLHHR